MENDYCRQIDQQMLVEAYVAGKLKGEARTKFEKHLQHCDKHAQAVSLEKALKKGIAEFARSEMKYKIQKRLEKQHDTRFLLLRYAAILLVAVITPLLIYYQFNIVPPTHEIPQNREKKQVAREENKKQIEETAVKEKKIPQKSTIPEPEQIVPETVPVAGIGSHTAAGNEKVISPPSAEDQSLLEAEAAVGDADQMRGLGMAARAKKEAAEQSPPIKVSSQPRIAAETMRLTVNPREAELRIKTVQDSSRIGACLRQHLSSGQKTTVRVTVLLNIAEDGKVDVLQVKKASFESEAAQNCITAILNSWQLSKGSRQQVEFELDYPPRRSP